MADLASNQQLAEAFISEMTAGGCNAQSVRNFADWMDRRAAETTTELHWPLIDTALQGAANALPVLFTMLTKAGLREGAMVADEINGNVLCAIKQLAHGRRSPPKTSGKPECPVCFTTWGGCEHTAKTSCKPLASTDDGASPSRPSPSSVECPKCRTQLAFEGDVCGLCE